MTTEQNSNLPEQKADCPSLPLLANSAELLRVRILPAEFARLLGVSKQSVSRWIASGKVSVNPLDGRLDVQAAVQQVLRNTDPGRLRARVLRQAVEDVQQLRATAAREGERVAAVEAELAKAKERIAYLEKWTDDAERAEEIFIRLIVESADELRTAQTDAWPAILSKLNDHAIIEADLFPEEDDPLAAVEAILSEVDSELRTPPESTEG